MLLGKIKIGFTEGLRLHSGIDIPFKCQNGLAGIVRREIRLPFPETGGIQSGQLITDMHQRADIRRGQFAAGFYQGF